MSRSLFAPAGFRRSPSGTRLLVATLCAGSIVSAGSALAADRIVNAEGTGAYGTIDDAVGSSATGDRVLLMPGIYTGAGNHDVEVQETITIAAYQNLDGVIIDCQGSAADKRRAFTVADGNPTFAFLTIRNGYAVNGGAIEVRTYTTTITSCRFIGNQAERGGAVFGQNLDGLNIDHSLFVRNRATIEGGAVYVFGDFLLQVEFSTFCRNSAHAGSGLFTSGGADLTLAKSIVALGLGGASVDYYYGGAMTVSQSDIWGHAGGDWVGPLAAQRNLNFNVYADPRFCDPDADIPDFRLSSVSVAMVWPWLAMGSEGADPDWDVPVYGVRADGSGLYPTIQAALDTVPASGEVVLAAGTYRGAGNTGLTFLGKGVTLRSRDLDAGTTIISGAGSGNRVVWLHDNETTATTISHLTLRDGNANLALDHPGHGGGVLLTDGAAVTLEACRVVANTGAVSGGLSALGGSGSLVVEGGEISHNTGWNVSFSGIQLELKSALLQVVSGQANPGVWIGPLAAAVTISGCEFRSFPQAVFLDHTAGAYMGITGTTFTGCRNGLTLAGALNVHVTGCTFTSTYGGGAITAVDSEAFIAASVHRFGSRTGGRGGSVQLDNCNFTFQDSEFAYNQCDQDGGALFSRNSDVALDHCSFANNSCTDFVFFPTGGAVFHSGGALDIDNCSFTGNRGNDGGAVFCENADFTCQNSAFTGNSGGLTGALRVNPGGVFAAIGSSLFADNATQYNGGVTVVVDADEVAFEHSTVAGNSGPAGLAQVVIAGRANLAFNGNLIAFGSQGFGLYPVPVQGVWNLACNDIHGNPGGDYANTLAAWQGVDGNLQTDPYFCDPEAGVYSLQAASVCLAANNSCGQNIGSSGVECPQVSAAPEETLPRSLTLIGNTPNPFNPQTEILFQLPAASVVDLDIHDVSGRKVRSLAAGQEYAAGSHRITWDGTDHAGRPVTSGIYFYRVRASGSARTGKMALVR
jgi:hypothetical protein